MTNKQIAGSSNGRTRDFGSRYLGSNPSPAAKFQNSFFRQNTELCLATQLEFPREN